MTNVQFVKEKNIVSKFFEHISTDSGMVLYGIHDTMRALENNSLSSIICYENLDWIRVERKNKETDKNDFIYIHPEGKIIYILEINEEKHYLEGEQILDFVNSVPITEYLAENYHDLNIVLNFITDKSSEGF